MFDRLKAALRPAPTPGPHLTAALRPLEASSPELRDRALAYVFAGEGPELLMELTQRPDPELNHLMVYPGTVKSWFWLPQPTQKQLKKIGLDQEKVTHARDQYYSVKTTPLAELNRFARLLTVLGQPNRQVDGVPVWLTALVGDAAMVVGRNQKVEIFHQRRAGVTVGRLAEMLTAEGMPEAEQPTVIVLALFQVEEILYSASMLPENLPGADEYLLAHGSQVDPARAAKLSAPGRVALAERAASSPELADALAHVLAVLSQDSAKTARTAAVSALGHLSPERLAQVLPPVLLTAPASRGGELVDFLARVENGPALLGQALAEGSKLATLIEAAARRQEALGDSSDEEEPMVLPDWTPLTDTSAAAAGQELTRMLEKEIALAEGGTENWRVHRSKKARKIGPDQIQQFVDAAEGKPVSGKVSLLHEFNLWHLANTAPSLNLLHLLRLARLESRANRWDNTGWVVRMRADEETDLRVIEDALLRTGGSVEPLAGIAANSGMTPQATWPWLSQHLDLLQGWLTGGAETATAALRNLEGFPRIPASLLPSVAAVALGESRTNRPIAQRALMGHPAAQRLAEQGLTDTKSEIRAAAAGWLIRIGEASAVPALRTALKKERREVVRAALLAALEALGDDITGDLAPSALLAEATKGLKAKPPASMAWFDAALIPAARWADGSLVDEAILRWWFVLAVKLKDPDGSGLLDRYLSLLHPDDAAAIGRHALRSWIAQDTRHHPEAESRAHAAIEGPRRWDRNQDWLKRVKGGNGNSQYAEEAAAIPVETHIAQAFSEHQSIYLGSATPDKGMLALTTRMPGIELAQGVQGYIRAHGGRRSQVESLVHALYANGDPAAIQLLLSISRRFKQVTVQAKAKDLVEALAESRGWSSDELADRTIPTAGFSDDRLLHLDFGSREFLGRVNAKGGIDLSDAEGKALKALPAPRAADDEESVAEAKKQLTAARKELKAVIGLQTSRFYEAMGSQRTWAVSDWQEFLAGHPLMSQLIVRLVWLENPGPSQRAFRPTEDGELIDAQDEPIEVAADSRIGLAHLVLIGEEAAQGWRTHLADYEVVPLFDQFSATLPELKEGLIELIDLRGHLTDTFSFRGVATKRGYVRGGAEDGGWFTEYTKPFSSLGLTAVLEFTGSFLPEENIPCATESLFFRRKGYRGVPLAEVPEVLVAECYADLAALAALGPFDPDYRKKSEY